MKILSFFLLALVPSIVNSQPVKAPFRERMEAAKVAFITRNMELTPQEARIFWPLYDAYEAKVREQRQARMERSIELRNLDELSDAEVNKLIDGRLEQAEVTLKARKEFIGQLRKELSPRKAAMFIRAEEDFQREVAERIHPNEDRTMPPIRRRP
jgi:hypothetical protein